MAERRPLGDFEARDLGIAEATRGKAQARVVRASGGKRAEPNCGDAELLFTFVLDGEVTLDCEGRMPERLGARDAVVVPPKLRYARLRRQTSAAGWAM